MPLLATQRIRIQRALVDAVKDYRFPTITYDANGAPNDIDPDDADLTVLPLTPILCNEITSSFGVDDSNGRDFVLSRNSWVFALRMKFDSEVLLELFEESLSDDPPSITRDATLGLPSVLLILTNSTPIHPVQQGGATGTEVEFTFEAQQGRK